VLAALLVICASACASAPSARGRRAMDDGAYEEAARAFREAAQGSPRDADLWLELGRAEMAAQRPARVSDAFTRASLLQPTNPQPRILIGHTWELERRWDEALAAYLQAVSVAPQQARPYRVLGTRLLRWGRPADAVEPLARAVALAPAHAETWKALALARYHGGDVAAAEQSFRDGIALHAEHRGLRLGLAALLVNAHRFEEALTVYAAVLDREPALAAAHVGRALLLHELHRQAEADAAFEAAVRVARDPRPYRARLLAYRQLRARDATAPRNPR